MSKKHTTPPFAARTIHRFSVLIILAWLAITVIMTIGVPPWNRWRKNIQYLWIPQTRRRSRR